MAKHHKMHGEHHGHHAHHEGHHVHHMVKKHSMHALKHRAHHAKGGAVEEGEYEWKEDHSPSDIYAGKDSHVVHEAEAKGATRKHGGRTKHHGHKHVEMHGMHAHHRLDRPARKSGGGVKGGAEMHPLSAANNVKTPAGRFVESGES